MLIGWCHGTRGLVVLPTTVARFVVYPNSRLKPRVLVSLYKYKIIKIHSENFAAVVVDILHSSHWGLNCTIIRNNLIVWKHQFWLYGLTILSEHFYWNFIQLCCEGFYQVLTHWSRDKITAIFQTTFSNAFSWMKMYECWLWFHWSLFLGVQLTIFQHWFR